MFTLANDAFNHAISEDVKQVLGFGAIFTVVVLSILTSFIRRIVKTRAREQTKRELAAYVAEGTMKSEDAERILKADLPKWERC